MKAHLDLRTAALTVTARRNVGDSIVLLFWYDVKLALVGQLSLAEKVHLDAALEHLDAGLVGDASNLADLRAVWDDLEWLSFCKEFAHSLASQR